MPTEKLKLETKTNMFGTDAFLVTNDGEKRFAIGTGISYDPDKRLSKRMGSGHYLFRSPNVDPANLAEIWDTVEGFTGKARLTAEVETKDGFHKVTAYMLIEDKLDATMFAFAHSLFEKWSDDKTKEAKAEKRSNKKPKLIVTKDGKVKVRVQVATLSGDPQED
jgi:hypothetical protein